MNQTQSIMEWSMFPYLKTADQLEHYLAERLSGHRYYYHYAGLGAINGILGGGFCISSVDRFNDHIEKRMFSGREKKYYSLCFSTGEQENLALWYLYSGVGGNGGRLQFTYNSVSKLLQSKFRLVEYDYGTHNVLREVAVLTEESAAFSLEDVLYADKSKKNGNMDIKYNTMTNRGNVSQEEWGKFVDRHKGFQKRQIWYYEKETRLMIELSDALYQALDTSKTYAVILTIPNEVMRYVKVRFAPNIGSLEDPLITQYPKIWALRAASGKLQLSEHAGTVSIDPCRYCTKKQGG